MDIQLAATRQQRIRNQIGIHLQRLPAGNQFEDEAHSYPKELLHAVKPKVAGWLPKPYHVFTEFTDDQQSEDDLAFCLEGEEQFFKAAA